jgi:hypothetical protein
MTNRFLIQESHLQTPVRSASLVEQRGFELPVLFGLFCPLETARKSGRFRPEFPGRSLGKQFSGRL